MIVPLIIVNVCFLWIAFGINEHNAKYLLSGYNTMTEKQRACFDIKNYLIFFRKFFVWLSAFSTLLFFVLYFFFDKKIAATGYAISLTLPFIYLAIKSKDFKIINPK